MHIFAYFNNESIEVDLNTTTTPQNASYCFSTESYSETNDSSPMSYKSGESGRATEESEASASYSETVDSLTMSYQSGESERSTEKLELSGKKSSANEGKGTPFKLLMSPTEETSAVSWLSQTFSESREDGRVENSAEDVDATYAGRESEDENESVDMKCLVGGIVNASEDIGHKAEGNQIMCAVDENASSEGQENECVVTVDASIESEAVASSDKLAAMMRDRVQAIKSIRGLLEREHQENDTVVELNNKMKILHYDIACKGQANKELMKTVDYLKSKNKDYTQQMSQLSSTVDELVLTKNENIQRISVLENDAAAKTIMIDEITAEIHNKNDLLEEKTSEIDELTEQLQHCKVENDGLKAAVEDLESKNTTFASELKSMMSSMQEVVELNGELQAQVNQVNFANEELREENNANVKKNAESLKLIEDLTKSLNDERTIHEREMEDMKTKMEMEKEVNAIIARKLEKTLEDVTARMTAQMSVLEDDVAAKKNMIDEITAEIQEMVVENAALTEQLERSKAENDCLKEAVQDLESKNTFFASELENMMSSMQEVVELNGELQAKVEQVNLANDGLREENNANEEKIAESLELIEDLTKSLNDERTIHEREMEDMKKKMETEKEDNANIVQKLEKTLEDVTAQMTAQMSALEDDLAVKKNMIDELERSNAESDGLKEAIQDLESKNTTFASELEKLQAEKESLDATMANLVTSLEEAMVYRKDVSCQNKQIQAKIEEVKRFVAQSFENIAGAIGQLEKDVEEEFQVTTQLKDGTEKLVKKLRKDKDSNYVSDVENLLGDVRMIQSWQLSHFQLVNELVTQNRDQVRGIQLLPAFRSFNPC